MLRVIQELRPSWVIGENVAGIVNLALDQVLSDLENIGYTCQALIIPACAVNAPHRRDRCAIVAYADRRRFIHRENEKHSAEAGECAQREPVRRSKDVADTEGVRQQGKWPRWKQVCGTRFQKEKFERDSDVFRSCERRPAKPGLGGVADGVPVWMDRYWVEEPAIPRITTVKENRADRLKCLGNAVVPQQFYPIFQAIADIERGFVHG